MNLIGPQVRKIRYQMGLTQPDLTRKCQLLDGEWTEVMDRQFPRCRRPKRLVSEPIQPEGLQPDHGTDRQPKGSEPVASWS